MSGVFPSVDVILVRPENAVNVGAVARAMRNTGLSVLRLVTPCDFRTVEAWRTAWGAHDVLENIVEHASLAEAIDGYDEVVALSGREGSDGSAIDVREMARRLGRVSPSGRVALVFGPEAVGLTEEDVRLCGVRARIPADPAQPSLNLSHAVVVTGYEVLRARREAAPGDDALVPRGDREALWGRLRQGLVAVGALAHDDERYSKRWRSLLLRATLSEQDVGLFEHLARKLVAAPRP